MNNKRTLILTVMLMTALVPLSQPGAAVPTLVCTPGAAGVSPICGVPYWPVVRAECAIEAEMQLRSECTGEEALGECFEGTRWVAGGSVYWYWWQKLEIKFSFICASDVDEDGGSAGDIVEIDGCETEIPWWWDDPNVALSSCTTDHEGPQEEAKIKAEHNGWYAFCRWEVVGGDLGDSDPKFACEDPPALPLKDAGLK